MFEKINIWAKERDNDRSKNTGYIYRKYHTQSYSHVSYNPESTRRVSLSLKDGLWRPGPPWWVIGTFFAGNAESVAL